jgi:hypothetical protein
MSSSAASTTTTTTLAGFAASHPFWALRLALMYLGNPILFVAYFARTSDNTSQDGIRILGRRTFRVVDDNCSRINLGLYVVLTMPPYLLWFWTQARVLIPLLCWLLGSTHFLNVGAFCARYADSAACASAIPGLLNLLVWSTPGGMEGNLMGMFCALPLLVAAFAYVALWIVAVGFSLEHSKDDAASSADSSGYRAL